MRVELISLRNGITKKKRLNVVSDAINKSKSDLVLFCGHSVFDWNDCVELSEKLVNKDSIVLFEAKKVDESTFLMRKNCLFRIEQGRLVNMFTNQFFASSRPCNAVRLISLRTSRKNPIDLFSGCKIGQIWRNAFLTC